MVLTKEDGSDHLGQFVMDFLSKYPDDICQVDGATGEQETKGSVLSRAIRLSRSLQKFGFQPGDVLALGGRNHLDVHIPFYAALMSGFPMAGVDPLFKYGEIKTLFKIILPKVTFCEPGSYDDIKQVAKDLGLDTLVITFRGGAYPMEQFMEDFHDSRSEELFKIPRIDMDKSYAWLVSTSGTTGTPKVAAIRHSEVFPELKFYPVKEHRNSTYALNLSSMQWISACLGALTLPTNFIKLQTSAPNTPECITELINKYKPKMVVITPTLISRILRFNCDMTCFDFIVLGGSKVQAQFLKELHKRVRSDTRIIIGYGQTETTGFVTMTGPNSPFGSMGRGVSDCQFQLVDPETSKKISEPKVAGELWVKGPRRMKEYYNDPEATAKAFTEDGWYKTGDLMYKDEEGNFFFLERIKMLLKYRNNQILPPEIEDVISTHPGVLEVCVGGVSHSEDGERIAACVVRRPGSTVSAQEIKDLVASKLSVNKQLTGGVVFVDDIPLTSTNKIARMKVKEFLKTAVLE